MAEKRQPTKYGELAAHLHRQIADGVYRPGDRIESENRLAETFGFSRQTVRQAIGTLEREGLLVRRRGSGTYVAGTVRASGHTMNIGVIATYITDYIFPTIIRGIEKTLTEKGYRMTLGVTQNRVENEGRLLRSLMETGVDGLIVEGTKTALPNPNLALYRKLEGMGIPVVFFNGYYRELGECTYVVTDDVRAGQEAAGYLLRRDCCRLGGVFKSDDLQGHRRYEGFMRAAGKAGISVPDDAVVWYTTADRDTLFEGESRERLFRRLAGCDGILCYNDAIAFSVIDLLQQKGIQVPRQVSVMGFDDSSISHYSAVKITTMSHPKDRMGAAAADMLVRMIETGTREKPLVMRMEPVIKDSVK